MCQGRKYFKTHFKILNQEGVQSKEICHPTIALIFITEPNYHCHNYTEIKKHIKEFGESSANFEVIGVDSTLQTEKLAMYITVRFGDSKEEIFNPNCRAVSLLRNIKDRCTFNDEDLDLIGEIELSDENGNIKFLRDSPMRYANEILANRESLVLLRVETRSDGPFVSYIPMLRDEEAITEEFMSRLSIREESESRPESRRVRSNTRRSPADRGNKTGKDKGGKNLKLDSKQTSRSKSRQGIR